MASQQEIPEGRGDSFLNPTGPNKATQHNPPSQGLGMWGELGLFAFFVFTKAVHPTIIAESKTLLPNGTTGYAYSSISTIQFQNVFVAIFFQFVSLFSGGVEEWKSIWSNTRALRVFGVIGVIFSIGDWVEMASLGSLSGDGYQVLLQSKFIVTALMMYYVKGTVQTRLQWMLLISLMITMSIYMCMTSKSKAAGGGGELPLIGMLFAFLKVIVSCFGAVLSDKYMKDLKNLPIHVQVVQINVAKVIFCQFVYLSEMDPEKGMFHGWDTIVCGVALSFIVKSVVALYFVAILDALLKNIGEAIAVLCIYLWIYWPSLVCAVMGAEGWCADKEPFDLPTFMAVFLVILLVGSYLDTKDVIAKAQKYEKHQGRIEQLEMGTK